MNTGIYIAYQDFRLMIRMCCSLHIRRLNRSTVPPLPAPDSAAVLCCVDTLTLPLEKHRDNCNLAEYYVTRLTWEET